MKYYKPCQLKVLSEVNIALCDANECTNSDLCVCFESIKNFHATGILKNFFFLIFRHYFGAKFQNGPPEIIKPFVTSLKYALKLVITRI